MVRTPARMQAVNLAAGAADDDLRRRKSGQFGQCRCAKKNWRRELRAFQGEVRPEMQPLCHASTPSPRNIGDAGSLFAIFGPARCHIRLTPQAWLPHAGGAIDAACVANADIAHSAGVSETPDIAAHASAAAAMQMSGALPRGELTIAEHDGRRLTGSGIDLALSLCQGIKCLGNRSFLMSPPKRLTR